MAESNACCQVWVVDDGIGSAGYAGDLGGGVGNGHWRCCSGIGDVEIPQSGDQRPSAGEDNAIIVFDHDGASIEQCCASESHRSPMEMRDPVARNGKVWASRAAGMVGSDCMCAWTGWWRCREVGQ